MSDASPDDRAEAIEARPGPGSGPPLMFLFKDRIEGEQEALALTRLIESRLARGGPLIFSGCEADSVVILQLVDGRWVPAWPAAEGADDEGQPAADMAPAIEGHDADSRRGDPVW